MVAIKKCRSLRHRSGGCGDPRCPEGLSIKVALEKALKDKDISAYLELKGMQNPEVEFMHPSNGYAELRLFDKKAQDRAFVRVPMERPHLVEQIKAVDKTIIPSFETADQLEDYARTIYPKGVYYRVTEDTINGYTVAFVDIHLDADLRSLGVARHLRTILMKHADEKGKILGGVPTNAGDGAIPETLDREEEYKERAVKHRARLVKFYLDSGYEYNYGYVPSDKVDWWTKEPYPQNREWVDQFNWKAQQFLSYAGFYIRWPNNQIPKKMLQRKSK